MDKTTKRHKTKKQPWRSNEVEIEQQLEEQEGLLKTKEEEKKKKKQRKKEKEEEEEEVENSCQGNEKSKHDQKSNNPAMKSAHVQLVQQLGEKAGHEEETEGKKGKKKKHNTNSTETEQHQETEENHNKNTKRRKSAPQDKLYRVAGPNAAPDAEKGDPRKKFKGEKGILELHEAHPSHEEHDRGLDLPNRRDAHYQRHSKIREVTDAARSCDSDNRSESSTGSHTVSIAVAGSILKNAQSLELATMIAGQIGRAAAIFRIDEVVVFDDGHETPKTDGESAGMLLVRILEYLEIPQYLRRALVPRHSSLCRVGVLPPLDAPHHARKDEWPPYREGVILDKAVPNGRGSYVDVGLYKEALIKQSMEAGTRVTVAMGSNRNQFKKGNALKVVERTEPKALAGLYWGYAVRYAGCLNAVFTECPFKDGYDYCVGTSEHGEKISSSDLCIPTFKHMLIAFGGLGGLEESLELDSCLKVTGVSSLFDRYLNTCPNQGSRTIRTEEAILISLQFFQDPLQLAIDQGHK